MDRGLNLNVTDREGQNVLHNLCQDGRDSNMVERIGLLVNFGVPVNATDFNGRNALHFICSRAFFSFIIDASKNEILKEQTEIAKNVCDAIVYLSEQKVVINERDNSGKTPLFCLYENGWFPRFPFETKYYVTKVTGLLVDLGLDINATNIHGANVLQRLRRRSFG